MAGQLEVTEASSTQVRLAVTGTHSSGPQAGAGGADKLIAGLLSLGGSFTVASCSPYTPTQRPKHGRVGGTGGWGGGADQGGVTEANPLLGTRCTENSLLDPLKQT